MTRSTLLIAAIALAATGCARGGDRVASYPAPAAQPGYQTAAPVYGQVSTPTQTYVQTPAPVVRAYPAQAAPRRAPARATEVVARPAKTVAPRTKPTRAAPNLWSKAAAEAEPAQPSLITPPKVEVARAQTEIERLNTGTPRAYSVPVDKPKVYSPFPRRKPTRPVVAIAQRLAAATPRTNSLAIPAPMYSNGTSQSVPPSIEYHIPHLPQEEPLWCWAAAAQQAIGWVNNGRAPAQCAIVALAHGISPKACCADPEGICARTGEIPAIAALVRRFGGQAAETASVPRDPQEVYRILQSGGTLLIRLRPAPHDAAVGIRHMIVVRGIDWLRLPNGQLSATLHYNDPLGSGQRSVDFAEIVGFFEQALIVRRNS